VRITGEKGGERHLTFEAANAISRQWWIPPPKATCSGGVPRDGQSGGPDKHRRVAVGGAEHQHDLVTALHALTLEDQVLGTDPLRHLHRSVKTQQFVHRAVHQLR